MRVHRIEVPIRPASLGPARPGFPSGTVNAWVLPEPPVTLVDCGPDFPEAIEALQAGLRAADVPLRAVEQILLTHYHPDHAGAAGRLAEATRARVLIHEADLAAIRDPASLRVVRWREIERALAEAGARPEDAAQARARFGAFAPLLSAAPKARAYGNDLVEAGGATFEVLHVPGHTPGHVALHAPRERVLFTGDALLTKITANANALVAKERGALGAQLASLERLLGLPACDVHPGHGEVFRDHGSVIGRDLAHHSRRGDKVLRALASGPKTAREVVDRMFLGKVDATFALAEVFGHLSLLEANELARPQAGSASPRAWALTPEGLAAARAPDE